MTAAAKLTVKAAPDCRFDAVSLGEVMLRLDPGEGRVHTTRTFQAWEGGGEYNVSRGLRRCFGLRTAHVTALADNPVGRLVEDLMLQGGVDLSYLRWKEYDGVGRTVRNGLNFTERGFGPRGGVGCSDRGHTAVSQMLPGDVDWKQLFGEQGSRWFHTGGVFCALSEGTPAVAHAAMEEAHEHGTCVSYDLNYRDSLWRSVGGKVQARKVNRSLMPFVDVLFGNEEDFSAALGFELENVDANFKSLPTAAFRTMINKVVAAFPNIKTVATTLRTSRSASRQRLGRHLLARREVLRGRAARRGDPRPRRRRRFVRVGLHLRAARGQGSAVGARVRRRARRAGDVDARRHHDGDVRRGDARDEGRRHEDRPMSPRRRAPSARHLPPVEEVGIVPVVRAPSPELAMRAAEAVLAGGISIFEITMTVPDAPAVIRALVERLGNRAVVGAGTVLDAEAARRCIEAGAAFIVSPGLDLGTIAAAHERGVPIMPGALTPTEVITAWKAGADMVKIFPASAVGGPKYLKALKGPLPDVKMLPTGGVNAQTAGEFIAAGACALGVGSELVDIAALSRGDDA